MSDQEIEPTTLEAVEAVKPHVQNNGSPITSKTFWAGVGIGSAAVIAALMYTKRPKKKK
ncbi:MAG: hypothetical protein J7494_07470 [Sphingobium sp.]|nr:hypothetical protein [Sphingobium sp.]